jgi:hypothetical protein
MNHDPKPEFLTAESARLKDAFMEGYAAGYKEAIGCYPLEIPGSPIFIAWKDSETHQMTHDS